MTYSVKEIFFTLQGEGVHTGRPAVFCRFAGCNLWSGLERDRASAICSFCDTDFVGTDGSGGGKFKSAVSLAQSVAAAWPDPADVRNRFVVCTGGEPMLQLDQKLIDALHDLAFEVAIETNGTLSVPSGVDWICVSPKSGAPLVQRSGHELKLVFPQPDCDPQLYENLDFGRLSLQPLDGPDREENTRRAIDYCFKHPNWSLSQQTHKDLGLR